MCRQFIIHGRVQGVFFRASTRSVAQPLGICGYARNLPDGTVEVLACGEQAASDRLFDWLHEGPPMASVTAVTELQVECEKPDGFATA